MYKQSQFGLGRCCCLLAMFFLTLGVAHAGSSVATEEQAIRQTLARFYEGWNAHDLDKMVSIYADDVDHINVFAEWHKGKESIRNDLRLLHSGRKLKADGTIAPAGHKTFTIEKIRFVRPDVAVVQVRSLSMVGNLGTYVLAKQADEWMVVSFTNVSYELPSVVPPGGAKGGGA